MWLGTRHTCSCVPGVSVLHSSVVVVLVQQQEVDTWQSSSMPSKCCSSNSNLHHKHGIGGYKVYLNHPFPQTFKDNERSKSYWDAAQKPNCPPLHKMLVKDDKEENKVGLCRSNVNQPTISYVMPERKGWEVVGEWRFWGSCFQLDAVWCREAVFGSCWWVEKLLLSLMVLIIFHRKMPMTMGCQ